MSISTLQSQIILTAANSNQERTSSSPSQMIYRQNLASETDFKSFQHTKLSLNKGVLLKNTAEYNNYINQFNDRFTSYQYREIYAVISFLNITINNPSQQTAVMSTVDNSSFTQSYFGTLKWQLPSLAAEKNTELRRAINDPSILISKQKQQQKQSNLICLLNTNEQFDIKIEWFMSTPFGYDSVNDPITRALSCSIFISLINFKDEDLKKEKQQQHETKFPSQVSTIQNNIKRNYLHPNFIWSLDETFIYKRIKYGN